MEDQLIIKKDEIEPIKCSNCNKDLMFVQKYERGSEILFKVSVSCPFCNDKSYEKEIYGTFRYHLPPNIKLKDFKKDDKSKKVHFIMCK